MDLGFSSQTEVLTGKLWVSANMMLYHHCHVLCLFDCYTISFLIPLIPLSLHTSCISVSYMHESEWCLRIIFELPDWSPPTCTVKIVLAATTVSCPERIPTPTRPCLPVPWGPPCMQRRPADLAMPTGRRQHGHHALLLAAGTPAS